MRLFCVLAMLFSCRDKPLHLLEDDTQRDTQDSAVVADADGDGFNTDEDCDDANDAIHPDAEEVCDGIDNNCDGSVDEDSASDAPTWYADADGDGYGNENATQTACDLPSGYTDVGTDCDDFDERFHPGADESDCTDPNDYNCDGSVGFSDLDSDGFSACEDCDDSEAAVSPVATEVCDSIDNNCDGNTDEDNAVDASTWYADADSDGYGDPATAVVACEAPSAHVDDDTDCDDTNTNVNEGALEVCDEIDNNCNGWVDDADPSLSGASTWYGDSDGDGYGGQQYQQEACSAPAGFVATDDDCDDLDATSHPGATEICDETDNDCDTEIDEGVGTTWYQDSDGDGYGNGAVTVEACESPAGHVSNALDCDDYNAATSPAAYEVCDSADNDCDGTIDEDAINASTWYLDSDNDGYGLVSSATSACSQPSGYAGLAGDCNDSLGSINPGAAELCDASDNNCDGQVDEGVQTVFYADTDSDGYGDPTVSTEACSAPSSFVTDATDCDDTESANFPGNTEICDGIDNNCDAQVDEGVSTTFYEDADSDGYGNAASTTDACSPPTGYVADATDCEDTESANFPGNTEICDGIDNDCNATVDGPEVLGSAAACPADSCLAILNNNSSATDGTYHIDPTSTGAYEIYCDMTNGGWTLAMKSLANNSELIYSESLWTDTSLLNETDFDVAGAVNSKYPAYNDMPFSELRLLMNSVDRSFSMASQETSLLSLMTGSGTYVSSPATAGEYHRPTSYWGLPADGHEGYHCSNIGINKSTYSPNGGIARIGVQQSQEYSCGHPGTSEGIGLLERDHTDTLNSGRLQWDGETNYFAQAFVYIR